MGTIGDPRGYNAFEAIEPYRAGVDVRYIQADSGDTILVRRFGPYAEDLSVSASCWSLERSPHLCCPKLSKLALSNRGCWPRWPFLADRCCTEGVGRSNSDPDALLAYDIYVDLSEKWSPQERLTWHSHMPGALETTGPRVTDLHRKHRFGYEEPHTLCPTQAEAGLTAGETVHLILALLQQFRAPSSKRFINVGAGKCNQHDPLHKVLTSPIGRGFRGLVMEFDEADLATCLQTLQAASNELDIAPVLGVVDPTTAGKVIREASKRHFGPADLVFHRWDLEVIAIDLDGCDCPVLESMLFVVAPKVVVLEIAFHIPPPFKFTLECGPGSSDEWLQNYDVRYFNAASGCSLSYAVETLSRFGLNLFRLAQQDAIFVRDDVAQLFERGMSGVRFPVDEFACYQQSRLWLQLPVDYVREWFFSENLTSSLKRLHANLSYINRLYNRPDSDFFLEIR